MWRAPTFRLLFSGSQSTAPRADILYAEARVPFFMHPLQKSIGRPRASAMVESKWWLVRRPRQIARVQLFTVELCVPFGIFHQAMEVSLGRPIWIHEFGLNLENLIQEFLGERDAPTLEEILATVPEGKAQGVYLEGSPE